MHRPSRYLVVGCLLLVCCCTSCTGDNVAESKGGSVAVTTEKEVRKALNEAVSGQTIQLNFSTLNLTGPLIVKVKGIIIEGKRDECTIHCPEDGSALTIFASVEIRNVRIAGCKRKAAVRIKPQDFKALDNVKVNLRSVDFDHNTRESEFLNATNNVTLKRGGAIAAIGSLNNGSCHTALVQLLLDSCTFSKNEADFGGAVYCECCDLTIQWTTFSNNTAFMSGGSVCIVKVPSTLTIKFSRFEGNSVKRKDELHYRSDCDVDALAEFSFSYKYPCHGGGAIAMLSPLSFSIYFSIFFHNKVEIGAGGAIYSHFKKEQLDQETKDIEYTIYNTNFEDNKAISSSGQRSKRRRENHGGAVYIVSKRPGLTWLCLKCKFLRNRAFFGGAFSTDAYFSTTVCIMNGYFEGNEAESGGGAILGRSLDQLVVTGTKFIRNKAFTGGGILITSNAGFISTPAKEVSPETYKLVTFIGNSAVDGGAIASIGSKSIMIMGTVFQNNTAQRYGGGVYLKKNHGLITITCGQFKQNVAVYGGGAAIVENRVAAVSFAEDFGDKLVFSENSAVEGGGLYVELTADLHSAFAVINTTFKNNKAVPYEELKVLSHSEEYKPSAPKCGNGNGGGLCFVLNSLGEGVNARIKIVHSNFLNNTAVVGAGMFIQFSGPGWENHQPKAKCPPPIISSGICLAFKLYDNWFDWNVAQFGGGAMHVSDPSKIVVQCSNQVSNTNFKYLLSFNTDKSKSMCLNLTRNKVVNNGNVMDQDFSSSAFLLQVIDPFGPISGLRGGSRMLPPCENCDPNREGGIKVAIKDAFNNTIIDGIPDSAFHVTLISAHILGEQSYQVVDGIININETRVSGVNTTNEIILRIDETPSLTKKMKFSTRPCYPGEVQIGGECASCDRDTYSFNSSVACKECPTEATCIGEATLVPKKGYWHSSPFSTQFHRCIIDNACAYENRSQHLEEYYTDTDTVLIDLSSLVTDSSLRSFMNYNQCSEGYTGTLCGSCEKKYGHFAGGKCVKCPESRRKTVWSILPLLLWVFLLLTFNILTTFSSTGKRIKIAKAKLLAREGYSVPSSSNNSHQNEDATQALIDPMNGDADGESQTNLTSDQDQLVTGGTSQNQQDHGVDHVIALEKLTQTLKILINYSQVTSTALAIDASWLYTIKLFLELQSTFTSVMNGSKTTPLDCILGNEDTEIPKSIGALWLRVFLALVFLVIFLSLIQLVFWIFGKKQNISRSQKSSSVVTYSIVVALVLFYYFYIDLTSEFMRAVNCIKVDIEDEGEEEYRQYSIATGNKFWVEDTNLRCFEGKHMVTGVLGVLGLLFYSLFLVVLLGIWLLANQRRVQDPNFIARYGFMYFRYTPTKRIALIWECVIFMRKALIAMVVVFAIHLRSNLQSIFALGVLAIALATHLVVEPFHHNAKDVPNIPLFEGVEPGQWAMMNEKITMNTLETASMVCSMAMFYSAIVVHDQNTSIVGKYMMTIFTLFINTIFVSFIIYRIYAAAVIVVELHLELYKPAGVEIEKGYSNPIKFVRNIVKLCQYYIQKHRAPPPLEDDEDPSSAL